MATYFGILPTGNSLRNAKEISLTVRSDMLQTVSVTLEQKDQSRLPFLRLPHPRTGLPCLFLPSSGTSTTSKIHEVQAVSPPDSRSWFLGEEVVSDGKLLIVTPIDPAFLLLPILQVVQPADSSAGIFRQADDIFEEAAAKFHSLGPVDGTPFIAKDFITLGSLQCTKDALRHVCDVKEISSDIVVYRLSGTRVLAYLQSKVAQLSAPNALEVSKSTIRALAKDGLMEDGKEALLQVGRVRAVCDLLSQYLTPDYYALLTKSYDFQELDAFLQISVDEAAAAVAIDAKGAKKAKGKPSAAGEKKRKNTKGSQGVEKLKKVNVNGMAKLSSFFKKAT